ncbi:MAG: sulfotransferase [Robiginitomaculum sp.]|nr:MAG: sulfotransferase [Robiginitomaculum sp.]
MTKADKVNWPQKTRELVHNHFDSAIWDEFAFRDDDIIITSYAKSGTTWLQQIVAQLIFQGEEGLNVADMSPWLDFRLPPKREKLADLEAQTHRRFVKTHLPVDALRFSPKAKYLYIARDGRDVLWSYYNHHSKHMPQMYERMAAVCPPDIEPFAPPQKEVVGYFHEWLARDGWPIWPYWDNINSWWAVRDLPNVMMLHFSALKADLPGQMRKISAFLDIPIDESKWDTIVQHCTFEYMKANAEQNTPLGGLMWEGGAKTFINKGTNGRWRDLLSAQECKDYEKLAVAKLGPECAHWLKSGELK